MSDLDLSNLTSYNVSDERQMELVDALLKCASISNHGRRDAVVGRLGSRIAANISRSGTTSIDVLNIVATCLQYEGGLAKLIAVVRFFEGDSLGMRSIDATLQAMESDLKADARSRTGAAEGRPAPQSENETKNAPTEPLSRLKTDARPGPAVGEEERRLKVFLSHGVEDKPAVRDLYNSLIEAGFEPWLDEENLLAGQDWALEIPKAVRGSDVIIVCISHSITRRAGYIHKEINLALDVAEQQPEGTIFVIPVRLEDCEVPSRLARYNWVDLFTPKGYQRLMRSLRSRAEALGVADR